jgi:hypothetical protein
MLKKVFGRNAAVWPAIEEAMQSVWADIDARHSL